MSLIERKKKIYDQIALLRTTNELNNGLDPTDVFTNTFGLSSVSRDPFILLLDLLKTVMGESGINKGINNILKGLKKNEKLYREKLKHEITSVLGGDKNMALTKSNFLSNGFKINVKKIDPNNKLFRKPNSEVDRNLNDLYLTSFEKQLRELIINPRTTANLNTLLSAEYDNTNGIFTFKLRRSDISHNNVIHQLIDELVDFDNKNLMFEVFDNMFNVTDKNKDELIYNEKLDSMLNKFITDDDIDDSYFKFSGDEVTFIEEKIVVNKINYYGDPNIEGNLSKENLLSAMSDVKRFNSSFFQMVVNYVIQSVNPKYREIARVGFFNRFIISLKNTIMRRYLVSTEMMVLYNMLSYSDDDAITYIKNNKNFVTCINKDLNNNILSILFNMLKKELLLIVAGVATLYVKESARKYKNILLSVIKR